MIARLLLAAALLVSAALAAAADERIERFVSDVNVQRNGDLLVTETIRVRAEGNQIRRGILRDFPTTYRRRDGARVQVGFEVESVSRDGADESFTTERMANGVRVRIGRADRTLNTGSHEYIIRYRTTRQIGFFDSFDELYWNATGNGWTFPIDVAEARINLPEGVNFSQSAFYTGPQGANGKDATIVEQRSGRIVFRTTRVVPVANGLTVAAAWPKGVVSPPTSSQQLGAILQDEPALLYAGIGGAGVILYYLIAWLLVGRDPPRGTVIPLFGPPDGMSPAAVRYLWELSADNRGFTAAIVGLGVKGHLKLIDQEGEQELRHVAGGQALAADEQAVASALFGQRTKIVLRNTEHEIISRAKTALERALKSAYTGKLFNNNFGWSGLGLIFAAAVVAAIGASYFNTYGASAPWLLAALLVPMLPIMTGVGLVRTGLHDDGTARIIGGTLTILVSIAIGLGILVANVGVSYAIAPAATGWFLAGLAALGFSLLKAPTREGRRVIDQVEGFRQYLSVAEEDRLEYLNPPKKTPELFEKFLPYAIALDVQNAWAKRFVAVLAAAGTAAAAYSWYQSDRGDFDPVSFSDRIGDSLASTISSASSPPGSSGGGSSGSSGGGSSGGGGGGGGGSGW